MSKVPLPFQRPELFQVSVMWNEATFPSPVKLFHHRVTRTGPARWKLQKTFLSTCGAQPVSVWQQFW
jgi:hypothetical protein